MARIKRAAASKRRADLEYRAALLAATAEGASFSDCAKAAGVSRQAVRQLVNRG